MERGPAGNAAVERGGGGAFQGFAQALGDEGFGGAASGVVSLKVARVIEDEAQGDLFGFRPRKRRAFPGLDVEQVSLIGAQGVFGGAAGVKVKQGLFVLQGEVWGLDELGHGVALWYDLVLPWAQEADMTVKTSISLRDSTEAFARDLVDRGQFPSLSAVVQHGLELVRQKTEAEATEAEALRALLVARAEGQFVSSVKMRKGVSAMLAEKRRAHGLAD